MDEVKYMVALSPILKVCYYRHHRVNALECSIKQQSQEVKNGATHEQ